MAPTSLITSAPTTWHGRWVVWAAGVVATFAVSLVVGLLVLLGGSTTCDQPAPAGAAVSGETHLMLAIAVTAIPWAIGLAVSRRFVARWLTGWLVGVAPLIGVALTHTGTQDWVGGFCF